MYRFLNLTSIRNQCCRENRDGSIFAPVLTGKNATCPVFPSVFSELDEFGLRLALKRTGAKKRFRKSVFHRVQVRLNCNPTYLFSSRLLLLLLRLPLLTSTDYFRFSLYSLNLNAKCIRFSQMCKSQGTKRKSRSNHLPDMYSRKDNAPTKASEIVLVGSADFFNEAMNPKSFKDE